MVDEMEKACRKEMESYKAMKSRENWTPKQIEDYWKGKAK